jgi:hypothetical protein
VFEVQGSSVLVQSEDQLVAADGQRIQTGKASATNHLFAQNFTAKYAELAKRDLVFADLQNVFDLGMVAALCAREGLAARIDWDLGLFAPTGEYQVASVSAPKAVESVLNHHVYNKRDFVVQVAGGVRADLTAALENPNLMREAPALQELPRTKAKNRVAGRWWWDAAR